MTERRRVAALLALPVAVLLTGCGVSETAFRPGVAVEVGEDRVSVEQVDQVADSLCSVLQSDPAFDGRYFRNSSLRNAAMRGLALEVMAGQLAEEYGVARPAVDTDFAHQLELQFGSADPDELATAMPAFTGDQMLREVLVELGRDEVGASADEMQALTAGVERAQAWQEKTDVDTNPEFEALAIGDQSVETLRDDLSVAVSDLATEAADPASQEAGEGTGGLPESQRCSG